MTCLPEFLIILLACFGLAMVRLCNNHDNENFVRAFNRQVPAHLQQETKDDIISLGLLSSYHSVDDYVFLWKFADKYDIVSFPDVDIHNINTILQHEHGPYYTFGAFWAIKVIQQGRGDIPPFPLQFFFKKYYIGKKGECS